MTKRARWQHFIHDARNRQRLDGPYSSRKAAEEYLWSLAAIVLEKTKTLEDA
jgi:hypothetical protein